MRRLSSMIRPRIAGLVVEKRLNREMRVVVSNFEVDTASAVRPALPLR